MKRGMGHKKERLNCKKGRDRDIYVNGGGSFLMRFWGHSYISNVIF